MRLAIYSITASESGEVSRSPEDFIRLLGGTERPVPRVTVARIRGAVVIVARVPPVRSGAATGLLVGVLG